MRSFPLHRETLDFALLSLKRRLPSCEKLGPALLPSGVEISLASHKYKYMFEISGIWPEPALPTLVCIGELTPQFLLQPLSRHLNVVSED